MLKLKLPFLTKLSPIAPRSSHNCILEISPTHQAQVKELEPDSAMSPGHQEPRLATATAQNCHRIACNHCIICEASWSSSAFLPWFHLPQKNSSTKKSASNAPKAPVLTAIQSFLGTALRPRIINNAGAGFELWRLLARRRICVMDPARLSWINIYFGFVACFYHTSRLL